MQMMATTPISGSGLNCHLQRILPTPLWKPEAARPWRVSAQSSAPRARGTRLICHCLKANWSLLDSESPWRSYRVLPQRQPWHAACHGMPNPWNPPEESPRGAHFHIWPCGPRGGYMSPPSRDNPPGPPNPQLENQHLGVWAKKGVLVPGATFNFATQFKIVQIMPGSLLCELWPSECYVFRSPKCSDANHVLRCPYRTMRLHALLGGTWSNRGSQQCCGIGSKRSRIRLQWSKLNLSISVLLSWGWGVCLRARSYTKDAAAPAIPWPNPCDKLLSINCWKTSMRFVRLCLPCSSITAGPGFNLAKHSEMKCFELLFGCFTVFPRLVWKSLNILFPSGQKPWETFHTGALTCRKPRRRTCIQPELQRHGEKLHAPHSEAVNHP